MTKMNMPTNDEFIDLMLEATNGEHSPQVMGPRTRALLEDAAQAGREWADSLLDRTVDRGCYFLAKNWLRNQATGEYRTSDGRSVSKSRLRSFKVRDPETGEVIGTQLKLLHEASWQELRETAARSIAQRDALNDGIEMIVNLLKMQAQYPDTYGPAEACERAGTTIEALLTDQRAA